jgi:hypothetical protein
MKKDENFAGGYKKPLVGGPTLLSGSPMPRQPVFDHGQKASICCMETVSTQQSIMVSFETPAIFTMDDAV